jgi:hypothetical protein
MTILREYGQENRLQMSGKLKASEDSGASDSIAANMRPINSYWYWREKPIMERGAAVQVLEGASLHLNGIVSRQAGQDPPDCEAMINGSQVGIEVTELVHRLALEQSLKGPKVYFNWERHDLLRR